MSSRIKDAFRQLSLRLSGLSPVTWMMAAFIVTYLYFFIRPIFLNPDHVMKYLHYVPGSDPIGYDLNMVLSFTRAWMAGDNPYFGQGFYPPLVWALFAPLVPLEPAQAFGIVTGVTLLCTLILTAGIPVWMNQDGYSPAVLLVIVLTGLFSYGLQFELERGQFSVWAMMLALMAVWLIHYHHRFRWVAYALLSLAIQLKIFPAIFALMLIRDWKAWRENLKLLVGLGAANLALFLVLGPRVFMQFLDGLTKWTTTGMPWRGNHSIHSFVSTAVNALTTLQPGSFSWMPAYEGLARGLLLMLVLGALGVTVVRAYRHPASGPSAYLLLACALTALLVPSFSNDYKLSMLAGPVGVLLCSERFLRAEGLRPRWLFTILVIVFSLAYFSTLYSYMNKPLLLKNNLPALMVMLLVTAAWALMDRGGAREPSGGEA
jgi:hypothetical protein